MKKQWEKRIKLNNEGSALLTVIVVVAFITVLATTMLYITGMNYQMKQTDYQNKKSFYRAEEALDGLKAVLAEDMSDAFQYAYQEVMVQYASLEGDARQAAFNGAFLDYLETEWTQKEINRAMVSQTLTDELKEMMAAAGYDDRYFIEPQAEEAPVELYPDRPNGRFVIRNIRVRYAENGYSSFICTDIAFCVPDLDLEHSSSANNAWTSSSPDRQAVVLTDYIIYMNWTKY